MFLKVHPFTKISWKITPNCVETERKYGIPNSIIPFV